MSYKLKRVYICDNCGKVALPEDTFDCGKIMPFKWDQIGKHEHYCDECAEAFNRFRARVRLEREKEQQDSEVKE